MDTKEYEITEIMHKSKMITTCIAEVGADDIENC